MAARRDAVVEMLRQRYLSAMHLGQLRPGDRVPSARDVARELGVDRRVVLAAYRHLEREGVIQLRQRSGIYFAPAAVGVQDAAEQRHDWLVDLLAVSAARGTPATALAAEVQRLLGTVRLRAACVECNEDQIAALCAELHADFGLETSGVLFDPHRDDSALLALDGATPAAGELRRADVLVTTPFHASEVKLLAERLGRPWIAVTLRADAFAELARLLVDGPAYAVVADPRFAYKLELVYRATAGARHFHALVAGRDDLGRIPPGAPTFVTALARARLGTAALPGREIVESRTLSTTSAREVLSFVVRANAAALAAQADA